MTREARLTQKRLEGEILKLLEGKSAMLRTDRDDCAFCLKYDKNPNCKGCPLIKCYPGLGFGCCNEDFDSIDYDMTWGQKGEGIPGALAIYLWLFEL